MILTAFDVKFHEKKDELPPRACRPSKKLNKNNVEKVDSQKVKKQTMSKTWTTKKLKSTMSTKWTRNKLKRSMCEKFPPQTQAHTQACGGGACECV